MRRKVSYEDFQVRYTPERVKHWRRVCGYGNVDRRRGNAADPVVYKFPAPVPEAAGKKIAFISDLHYHGSDFQRRLIGEIREYLLEYKPDLLLLGGDVCCDVDTFRLFPEVLHPLSSAVPAAFAVPGNWERGKSWISAARWKELFLSGGFTPGFNEFADCGCFQIYCGDDPSWGNPVNPGRWREKAVRILLTHRPDTVIALTEPYYEPFHLALCGHTHGGQIRLPFIGPVFAASIYGCALDYGCFYNRERKSHMIVSSGLGHMSFPLRINCRREIVFVEFFPAVKTVQ